MSRIYPPKHGREHRPDGSDETLDGPKIYVGTSGVDGIDTLLAANPHPYATGDTPGPVPYENSYTADSTGTYEPVWFGKTVGGNIVGGGVPVDGTAGQWVYTLPAGYRPAFREPFANYDVEAGTTAGGWVEPDGKVYIVDQTLGSVTETNVTLSDNTTNDVTSSRHGFAPKSPGDATKFLNGAATPAYAQVKDSDLSTSDITTNNVTTAKHGFVPKGPNTGTQFLRDDATWATPSVSGDKLGLTPTAVKTTGYTAAAGDLVPCDTTSAGFTVTLPSAPADGTVIEVIHVIQGGSNTVTVTRGGSDVFDKASGPTSKTITNVLGYILLQYKASSGIWYEVAALRDSGVTAGTYGDATDVAQITVSADGRVTSVTPVVITGVGAGALGSGKALISNTNYTTTSRTFVDVDASNVILTFNTGARRVLLGFTGMLDNSTNGAYVFLDVTVDGTRQGTGDGLTGGQTPPSDKNGSFTYLTDALSAGSHTFKLQYYASAGTGEIYAGSGGTPAMEFWAVELYT